MKKKRVKKNSLFNTEIANSTTLKRELIKGVISAIVSTIVLYLTLVTYNYEIRLLLRAINEGQIKTIEVIIWSFCTILLVTFMLRLGEFLVLYSKKK